MDEDELARLLHEPIDWRYKGRPADRRPLTLGELGGHGCNLLAGDLLLPAMVLKESALDHNIALVARYCEEHGVSLAPHGKTTMAPQLFARQLAAGAGASRRPRSRRSPSTAASACRASSSRTSSSSRVRCAGSPTSSRATPGSTSTASSTPSERSTP